MYLLSSRLNTYLKIFSVIINTLIKQLRLYEQRAPWIDVFSSVQNVLLFVIPLLYYTLIKTTMFVICSVMHHDTVMSFEHQHILVRESIFGYM